MGLCPLFNLLIKMNTELKDKLLSILEKPLMNEGIELVDMTVARYKNNTTIRLFVYSKNGITIDECTRLSPIIGDIIDGTDYFKSGYALEVSSPGLDRPLVDFRDFKYRIGEKVIIDFVDNKRKSITAEIIDALDNKVKLKNQSGEILVDMVEIKKAKIIY